MTLLDYLVILLYALGMLAVGRYFSKQVRTADDYLLGGRAMPPLMIGLSLFATLTSTLSYLALPGEMIKNGPVVFSEILSFPLVMFIVGWLLIPRIMQQRVTSGYELLEKRLGLTGRLTGASLFVLLRVFWMATVLFATADKVVIPLLVDLLGPAQWWWLPVLGVVMGMITLAYTVQGGLKAVVVTDAVQAVLMFLGAIITIAIITIKLGGVGAWWPSAWPGHWPELKILPTPGVSRTVVGAFTAMLVWMTCTAGSDQMSIQRYLATRDAFAARRSFAVQLISNVVSIVLLGIAGLAVMGYFQAHPEELKSGWGIAKDADKLLPHFIVIGLPAGITGLVMAAILAAAMSSLSSGMNSSSTVIVTDFIGRAGGRVMDSAAEIRLARYVSVAVGLAVVAMSLVVGGLATNLLELCFKVVNLLTAPIFVLFFLALFVPRATPFAAVAATIVSVSTAVVVAFGWNAKWFLWSPPAALLVGITTGTLVSIAFGRRGSIEAQP